MSVIIFYFVFLQVIDYFVIVAIVVLIRRVVVEFGVSMCTAGVKINVVRMIVRVRLMAWVIF